MTAIKSLLGPGLVVACLLPSSAKAQDTLVEDGVIIITGTRADRALDEEPYVVEVVDLQQLERELPRTVPEALDGLSGVLVQKTASGHGSPYIRGFTGNRTLLVIDGIRYNNATYRDGANEYFAQVDSFTLGQIELISGPASALYGSEAVGGTLSLSTRPSSMELHEGDYLEGEQIMRFSSGDRSVVSRTSFDVGQGDKWGFRGGLTARRIGDVRAAEFGQLPYTGYSETAFDGRLDVALATDWTATFTHQTLWQYDVPRTHSTVFAVPFAGTEAGSDRRREKDHERSLTYAKLRGETGSDWAKTLEFTLSHQSRSEEELRIRGNGRRTDQSFTSELTALSGVGTASVGILGLTYGFDLSHEAIDSGRFDTDPSDGSVNIRLQGPVGDDATYEQEGVFLRADWSLTDAILLETGLRFSHVSSHIGTFADPVTGQASSFRGDWSNLSGSLRAQYMAGEHRFWLAYSRSFRAPNVADTSRFGASRSNEIEVASLNLAPEKFDTLEAAYRYSGLGYSLGVTTYTTALIDYIETVPTGRIRDGLVEVAKQNAASGRITGLDMFATAELAPELTLEGNLTYLRGRLSSPTSDGPVREPISRIQPFTVNIAMEWERDTHWLRAEARLAQRADELSSGDLLDSQRIPPDGTPGYALVTLRGGTELSQGLELTLALENLLDETWRPHGSGTNEPGRHVVAGLHFTF